MPAIFPPSPTAPIRPIRPVHRPRPPEALRRRLTWLAAIAALQVSALPALAADYSWNIGDLSQAGLPATLGATDTLAIGYGNYKYVDTGLATQGAVSWLDSLYFRNGNTISNSGVWTAAATAALSDGGYGGSFVNGGRFDAAANTVTVGGNIGFVNSGVVNAGAGGVVNFNTGLASFSAGSQFTGAGVVSLNNGAVFNGAFSSQNLQWTAGTYTGSGAQINGSVSWVTGTLAGDWQLDAGQALALQPGNYHYLNGSLGNLGSITVQDTLYFQNGSTLTNTSLYDMHGDVALADGGYGGSFVNNGILRKSAGSGASTVGNVSFVNNGEINAQTGSVDFNGAAPVFNSGTRFTGSGQVTVNTSARFIGSFTTASNLTLGGGATFTGGDGSSAQPTSQALMNGNLNWQTGSLAGSWTVAAGTTLTLLPGNYHYLNGSLNNLGTMAAQDTLYLQNGSQLGNASLYDLQGDVGLADGGYSGTFTNNGIFRKSAGSGVSTVGNVGFVNNGEINVRTGTLNFNGAAPVFNNGTRFTGSGQVAVNTSARFVGSFTTAGNLTLGGGASFTGGDGSSGQPTSQAQMNGNTHWQTGSLVGSWKVGAGTTLSLLPGNYHYLNGSLNNQGTVAAQDTLYLQNGSTLTNQGTYRLQGDVGVGDGGYAGSFVNTGLVVKTAGTGNSSLAAVHFSNGATGVVDVQTGTIQLPTDFVNQGTLKGVGTYATNLLTNAGHVAPGESPGTLSINGSFTQTAAGSFDVELGGTAGHDLLAISGTAALDGTLELICFARCNYSIGDTIVIMSAAGGVTGLFAGSPVLSGFAAGAFAVSYATPGEVVLTVTQATVAAVPEPQSYALLLAGLAAVGFVARRRRG